MPGILKGNILIQSHIYTSYLYTRLHISPKHKAMNTTSQNKYIIIIEKYSENKLAYEIHKYKKNNNMQYM